MDVEKHLRVESILHLVFGIYAGVSAFGAYVGVFEGGPPEGTAMLMFAVAAAQVVLNIIAFQRLRERQDDARGWCITGAAFALVNVPLGTAFGIYALWVQTRPEIRAALSAPT